MNILIWAYNYNGGPYDIDRQLNYKTIYNELLHNFQANSMNIGNKVWIQGIISELSTYDNNIYFLDNNETWDDINSKYDLIVYSAANMFAPQYNNLISEVTRLFKNSKLPIYVISIGAQTNSFNEINDLAKSMTNTVPKFMEAIYNTGGEVACRGYFTKEFLDKVCSNTAEVVGCPSLFQNGRNLIINKKSGRLKPIFNGKVKYNQLYRYFDDSIYIDQDAFLEFVYNLNDYTNKDYIMDYIVKYGDEQIELLLNDKVKIFYDIPEWKDYIEKGNYNFSIGTRIHGNIISILSSIPSIVIPCDSRTKEMAEFYNIPMLDKVESYMDVERAYNELDYSNFNKKYPKLYDNFNYFLVKHKLVKQINNDNIYWKKKLPNNINYIDNKRQELKHIYSKLTKYDRNYYKLKNKLFKLLGMKKTRLISTMEKYTINR